MGMVTNFVGIQKDFTVPCGVRADVGLRVKRADGSPAAVGRATWRLGIWRDGAEAVATRFGELLPAPDGAGEGDLFWRFPVLEAGLWRYELTARGSDGEVARVFYGVIGSAAASDIVAAGEVVGVKGWRMLEVWLPEEAGGKVEAHWLSGDYVLALCEVARSAAGRAEAVVVELDKAVEEATGRAESAAERAEEAATVAAGCARDAGTAQGGAEEALRAVEKKFAGIDEVIERWNSRVSGAIYPSSETGTWVVGDYVTSAFWQGVPAHIGTSGNWMNWNLETQSWEDSGVRAAAKDGFSPYVDALGCWVYVDPATGQLRQGAPAAGKDGIDGTAVRFILVDSYEEIPQSGETCNGGFRYLVRKEGWAVIGEPAATGNGEWEAWEVPAYLLPSEFTHLRVPGVLNENATPVYLMVRTAAGEVLGVSQNAVTWEVGDVVTWEFAEAVRVPNGAVVQMFLRTTNEGVTGVVPDEGVLMKSLLANEGVCRVRYENVWYGERTPYLLAWGAGASEFYEVYAWVEHDGSAGWVRVDRTNELATARVYGVMKYATDRTVVGGAPVGRNAEGQACVPVAEFTVAGTVKPTNELVFDGGGGTHMTPDGGMRVDAATTLASGSVLLSFDGVVTTMCIGLTADGRASVPWATLTQEGVIKLGSRLDHVNSRPYIVGIGATVNHEIAFNVLTGGAMKHLQGQSGWRDGMAPGLDLSGLSGDSIFFGLDTSDSFSQAGGRLSLMEATGTLLGGVRKMLTLGSGDDVPTGGAVTDYLGQHYYRKESLYTRTELTRDGGVIDTELQSRVPLYAAEELRKYVKSTDADERYAKATDVTTLTRKVTTIQSDVTSHGNSIAAVAKDVETLKNADGGYLKMVGAFAGTVELWGGSAEEFAKADITGKRMFMVLEN